MNFVAGTKLYHYVLDLEDKTFTCYPCEIAYIKHVDSGTMSWKVAYIRKHFNGRDILLKLNVDSIGFEKIHAGKYLWLIEKDDEKAKSMFFDYYFSKVNKSREKFINDDERFRTSCNLLNIDLAYIREKNLPFNEEDDNKPSQNF